MRDCTSIRTGLTLLGRGRGCGTVDVYVHCRRAWSDLPKGGLGVGDCKLVEFDKK